MAVQPLQPGIRLGAYEVIQQIGSGGHASVWLARDPMMNRHVAIKQFHLTGDNEVFRQRFLNEARMQQRASEMHPVIVRFIDVIDDPQRGMLLVMEYVDGFSLEQLLDRDPAPYDLRQVVHILRAMGLALQTVHSAGLIHRDIKPSNILMPVKADKVPVRLCDMGLATLISEQEALTLGSVRYMAPELFDSQIAVDGRADLYSLGMVCYELLIGRGAFEQTFRTVLRDRRSTAMRWMKWHTNRRLAAPPAAQVHAQVPPQLSELIARLMDKDPLRRVQSASELLTALDRITGARPAASAPGVTASAPVTATQPAGDTARLPGQRRWLITTVAAVAIVATLAGAGYLLVEQNRQKQAQLEIVNQARHHLDTAWASFEDEAHEEARAALAALTAMESSLAHGLQQRGDMLARMLDVRQALAAGDLAGAREHLDALEEHPQVDFGRYRALRAEWQQLEQFKQELAQLQQALEAGQLGNAQQLGNRLRAMPLSEAEMVILSEPLEQLSILQARRHVQITLEAAEALAGDNRLDDAIRVLMGLRRETVDPRVNQRLDQYHRRHQMGIHVQEAREHQRAGRIRQAIEAYEAANALSTRNAYQGQINQLRVHALLTQANAALQAGHTAEARQIYTQIQAITNHAEARNFLESVDRDDRLTAARQAAEQARLEGRYEEAATHYQTVLDMEPDDAVRERLAQMNLAHAVQVARRLDQQGDHDQARNAYQAVLALDPQHTVAWNRIQVIDQQSDYRRYLAEGDVHYRQGKLREAQMAYDQARQADNTQEVRDRLGALEFERLALRTQSLIQQNRRQEARAMLDTLATQRYSQPDVVERLESEWRRGGR